MAIRKILPSDNAAIASMIREVFHEFDAPRIGTVYNDPLTDVLFETFERENAVLWVAEEEGSIAGSCGIYPTEGLPPGCAELVKFYLPASARGRGIGLRLIQQSIQSAKEMGYNQLYLESMPQFSKAVKMYEQLGFKSLDNPMGNSGHSSCNLWMLKKLD